MSKGNIRRVGWICLLLFSSCCALAQTAARAKKPEVKSPNEYPLYIPIRSHALWGYADTSEHIVIVPQFDAANPFIRKYAVVEKNKKAYAIDRKGRIVSPGFDQLIQVDDTILSIYSNEVSDTIGGWGICTISGKTLLKPAYDEVVKINQDVYAFRKNSLWGMVNTSGTLLSDPQYDTIRAYGADYVLVLKEGKIGITKNDGKEILAPECVQIYRPNLYLFIAKKKDVWGAVNYNGDPIVPFAFDTLYPLNSYFIEIQKKDSIDKFHLGSYFTRNPLTPTPCIYKNLVVTGRFWLRAYDFKNLCGLMDTNGTMIIPMAFNDIMPCSNGNWLVQDTAKKWGLYSHDGRELFAPQFTRILPFKGGITVALKDNRQCLINCMGEILVPEAIQQINIRGNVVKVLSPDSSATFYTIGTDARVADKSSYEKLRTLTIGGREQPTGLRLAMAVDTTTGGLLFVPPGDSLEWFMDGRTELWGMRNAYTGELLYKPQFTMIKRCAKSLTLVQLPDTIQGPLVDSLPTYTNGSVGLVSDTTGKYILKPVYASINAIDIAYGFSGCVRATLNGGQQAIVSTDGNETQTTFAWIGNCQEGVARVCVNGKFTTENSGESILIVQKFTDSQNLNGFLSFGIAYLSSDFKARAVRIKGGTWGYIDSTGKVLVEPQYDAEKNSLSKTGIVKKEKKWGLIDMSNRIILPFEYDGLNYLTTSDGNFIQAQKNELRYGYIDSKGNIIVPADLHQTLAMGNGYIGFSRTGKWGVMNPQGETISEESYHEVLPFSEGYAQVRRGKYWGYIDTTGREITPLIYEKSGKFSNGMARVMKNSFWGFINTTGEIVIEPKYIQAGDFLGAAAPVKTKTGYGLISKNDKWLLKPTCFYITQLETTNFFVITNESYTKGLCRSDGKMLVSPRYEAYKFLGEGRIAYRAGLYWGIVDTSGKTVTGPVFERILPFSENRAAAGQDGMWGYINRNGRFVIAPQFRSATPFSEHLAYVYITAKKSGGYIDTTGKVVFWIGFDCAGTPFSDGKAMILTYDDFKREHYFYLNRRGMNINRFQYDNGKPFTNGAARVCQQKTWGMVSFTGYYLVKPRFFQLDEFDHGLARFQLRYTYGLYALDGKEVLPMQYDALFWDREIGLIRFERANSLGYLFGDGRTCWGEME